MNSYHDYFKDLFLIKINAINEKSYDNCHINDVFGFEMSRLHSDAKEMSLIAFSCLA